MVDRLKQYRRLRDKAGILLSLVAKTPRGPLRRHAWQIYHAWRDGKLTYRQALARLKKLAREAK